MGTPSDSARLSLSWTLPSPLDVPVAPLGDPRLSNFPKGVAAARSSDGQ